MAIQKKNILTAIIILFTLVFSLTAQAIVFTKDVYAEGLDVTPYNNEQDLITALISSIIGEGIEIVGEPSLTGNLSAFGIYTGGDGIIGFNDGIILSTGTAQGVVGPNDNDFLGTDYSNNKTIENGDEDLQALLAEGITSYDAAVLEFDFIPQSNYLSFQYVFSSEEYNEYANDDYNDTFAFFLEHNGTKENIAIIPGTDTAVSINTVNGGNPLGTNAKNPNYYINNERDENGNSSLNTQMDGLTSVMNVSVEGIIAGDTYHIKLAICDGGDGTYDSNVFIKAGSITDTAAEPGDINIDSREGYDVYLVRNNGSDGTVSVEWQAKDSNGTLVDSGTVTFGDGDVEETITVPQSTDSIILLNPTGGGTISGNSDSCTFSFENIPALDNIPPEQPSVPDLAAASDTGASSTDSITSHTTPTLTGTAEANSTVTVISSIDGTLGTTTADGSGSWTFTSGELTAGTHSITATATDAAGNTSSASSALSVKVDTSAPSAPTTPDLAAESDTGESSTDKITSDTTPTLTGTAEANSTVAVISSIDGTLGTTAADGSGNWTFTSGVALTNGTHNITATSTDAAGNTSLASSALSVTIDTSAPSAPTALDLSTASGSGESGTDNITSDTTPTLTGTAEADSTVTVISSIDGTLGTTTADGTGNWTFTSGILTSGVHSITATAADAAGNTSTASSALSMTIDTDAPTVTLSDDESDNIVKAGDTVTITVQFSEEMAVSPVINVENGNVANEAMTDSGDGIKWTYEWTVPSGNTAAIATVSGSDIAGNAYAGSESISFEIDNTAPIVSEITAVTTPTNDNTPSYTFYTDEAGTLSIGGSAGSSDEGAVTNGNHTITLTDTDNSSALSDGTYSDVTITVTDAAGNISSSLLVSSFTIDTSAPSAPTALDLSPVSDTGASGTDNITNDTAPTLTATAESNSTITVISSIDGTLGTTTADGSGDWTFTSAELTEGVHSITATAADAAGNTSSASSALSVTIDTGTPPVPSAPDLAAASDTGESSTDNITSDTAPTLTGTAEADSTVTVISSIDGTLGTTTADGSGNWTFTSGELTEGTHSITATAADAAGNISSVSSALPMTIDTDAPTVTLSDDESDNIVKAGDTVTITAQFSEEMAVSPVINVENGNVANEAMTDSGDGTTWTYEWTVSSGNTAAIATVSGSDIAGDAYAGSESISFEIDNTAPIVSEITAVTTPTNDNTPEYTFTTDEEGILIVGGSAGSSDEGAVTSGNHTITLTDTDNSSALSDGTYSDVTITVTDAAGNISSSLLVSSFTIDTSAPSAPTALDLSPVSDTGASGTDNITSDTTPTLTATAEEDSTVTVISSIDGTLGTTAADGSGNWTFTSAELTEGVHSITATATDAAGNTSLASSALSVTIDTSAPSAPTALDLSTASDTGESSTDNITSDTTPTLTGTAEADSTVAVISSIDGTLGTTVADGSGNWTFTSGELTEGVHSITATAADAAGNTSSASSALSVTIDVDGPTVTLSDDESDNIVKAGDTVTITAQFSEEMTTAPTINIENGNVANAAMTDSGDGTTWTYEWTVSSGDTTALVMVSGNDIAGNAYAGSDNISFEIDNTAPTVIEITAVTTPTNDNTPEYTFTTDEEGILIVGGSAGSSDEGAVTNGNHTITLTDTDNSSALSDGTYSDVTITVTDAAGNISSSLLVSSFTIDTSAPSAPTALDLSAVSDTGASGTDNITNDTTPTLTGTAEEDSTVTVISSIDGILGTTTADGSGNWTFTSGILTSGVHSITATAADAAGNTSSASSALSVTIDTSAPSAPTALDLSAASDTGESGTDNITSDTAPTLTGTAEANSTVTIISSIDGTLGTTTADGSGNWTFTSGELTEGTHSITATAADAAGNISSVSSALSVTIDIDNPTVALSDDDEDNIVKAGDKVEIIANFSEEMAASPAINIENGNVANAVMTDSGDGIKWTYEWTVPQGDMTATVTASGIDVAGNVYGESSSISFKIDNTLPTVTLSDNESDNKVKAGDKVIITAQFSEEMAASPAINIENGNVANAAMTDSGDGIKWTYEWTVPQGDTTAAVTVSGSDIAENTYAGSDSIVFILDNTPPAVSLSDDEEDNIVKAGDKVEITAEFSELVISPTIDIINGTDTGDITNVLLTGNSTIWTYEWTVPQGNKTATVTVKGSDDTGNTYENTDSLEFRIDNTKPEIADIVLSPEIWTNEDVDIIPSINDESSITVTKYVYGTENASQGIDFAGKFTVTKNNIYTIYAEDAAGNSNEEIFQVDIIDKDKPLIENIQYTPDTWTNEDVEVSFTVNDDSGSGVSVTKYVYGERDTEYFLLNGTELETNKFTVIDNGRYTIYTEDKAGNRSVEVIEVDNIDRISPTKPKVYRIPDQDFYNDEYTVRITPGTDGESTVAQTVYKMSGAINTGWSEYTDEIIILEEGTTTIKSKTIDKAGNESSIVEEVICIDEELYVFPTIIIDPDEEYSNEDYTVSIDIDFDNASVADAVYSNVYYKTSHMGKFVIYNHPFIIDEQGETEITVKVRDRAGNVNTISKTVFLDKTKPDINGVTDGVIYKEYRTITFNEGEATLNGLAFESGTTINKNGNYTLIVADDVGNTTTVGFTIDNDEEWVQNDTDMLDIGYSDGDSSVWVTKDIELITEGEYKSTITWSSSNEAVITPDGKVTLPSQEDGDMTVTLTATIRKGNAVKTKKFTVKVLSDATAPVITLLGEEEVTLEKGELYVESGFTAIDNVDGDITDSVKITGLVDTDRTGTYIRTYTAEDTTGNISKVTRTIIVNAKDVSFDSTVEAENNEEILDEKIEEAIENAGKDSTNEIKIKVAKEVTKESPVEVSISKKQADNAKQNNVNVIFETENTTIKVPMSAVDTSTMGTNSRLEMVVEQVDTDAQENKDIVDAVKNINENMGIYENKIFDFKMRIVEEDEEGNVISDEEIEDFTSEDEIELKILVGTDVDGATTFMTFYYNEERKAWEFIRAEYDEETGEMILLTNHLSIYSVMHLTKAEKQEEMAEILNKEDVTIKEVLNVLDDPDMEFEEETLEKYNNFTNTHKEDVAQDLLDNRPESGYDYNVLKQEFTVVVTIRYNEINSDEISPTIELIGNETVTVYLNKEYEEQGATATDNIDGDITGRIVVTGSVDISVKGEYTLTYTVTDLSGNSAQVTRIVKIKSKKSNSSSDDIEVIKGTNIEIINGEDNVTVAQSMSGNIRPNEETMKLISDIYEIQENKKDNSMDSLVAIEYDPEEVLNEEHLAVYVYDEDKEQWKCLGGIVDKENNKISVEINHSGKIAVMEYTKTFKDVQGHWAQNAIEVLAARQIIDGDELGNFNPNQGITRAEFAALIARIFSLNLEDGDTGFADIENDAWYAPYISASRKAGVVKGVSESEYEPDRVINREEMTAIVLRAYAMVKEISMDNTIEKFDDNEEIGDWAHDYVYTAKSLDIVQGRYAGNFVPKDPALKGEAAALIYRLIEKLGMI